MDKINEFLPSENVQMFFFFFSGLLKQLCLLATPNKGDKGDWQISAWEHFGSDECLNYWHALQGSNTNIN